MSLEDLIGTRGIYSSYEASYEVMAEAMRAEPRDCRHELLADHVRQARASMGGGAVPCVLCAIPVYVPPQA